MNGIVKFRKCSLKHSELILKVDKATDNIYLSGKIPDRHIPARPDEDFDLITGELIYRFDDAIELLIKAKEEIKSICDALNVGNSELINQLEVFINNR